jgi:predicted ATPase
VILGRKGKSILPFFIILYHLFRKVLLPLLPHFNISAMKIKSLSLRHYKRFAAEQQIAFTNEQGQINDITLLVGENGSGKTSILQAIVAMIGNVNRRLKFTDLEKDWEGFNYQYLRNGNRTQIEVEIAFETEETQATLDYANQLISTGKRINPLPSQHSTVNLSWNYDTRIITASHGTPSYYQFGGYQYALQLKNISPDYLALFEKVGSIYWYTEQRTAHSVQNLNYEATNTNRLRDLLARTHNFHVRRLQNNYELRPGQRDAFETLQQLYAQIFPGRRIVGSEPNMYDLNQPNDFWFNDGTSDYELSGLSAGERALFPILLDFALMNINHSIIIIDEIELHLHPRLLQNLLRALPNLGYNNQFIISSHSPYVMRELPHENILLAKDGYVQPLNSYTQGRNPATILDEIFQLPERTPEALQLIQHFHAAIEQQNLQQASQLLEQMTQQWGDLDVEVVRSQMYYEDLLNDLQHETHH